MGDPATHVPAKGQHVATSKKAAGKQKFYQVSPGKNALPKTADGPEIRRETHLGWC